MMEYTGNKKRGQFFQQVATGEIWEKSTSVTNLSLKAITYGKDQFIVVGDSGAILTSRDATEWTIRNSGTKQPLKSVVWGSGKFIALDNSGKAITSPDGSNWSSLQTGNSQLLAFIVSGDNQFVATSSRSLFTSPDGVTWTKQYSDSLLVNFIIYTGSKYMALSGTRGGISGVLTSGDGVSWVKQDIATGNNLNCLAYGNNLGVIVGNFGTISSSIDGTEWIPSPSCATYTLSSIAFGKNRFVAAGEGSTIISLDVDPVLTMADNRTAGLSKSIKVCHSKGCLRLVLGNFTQNTATVNLYTLSGRLIRSTLNHAASQIVSVPITEIPAGVYIVSVFSMSGGLIDSKLVAIRR